MGRLYCFQIKRVEKMTSYAAKSRELERAVSILKKVGIPVNKKTLNMQFNVSKFAKKRRKQVTEKMARRKHKSHARRFFGRATKSYRHAGKKSMDILGVNVMEDLVFPGAYGAVRPTVAKYVTPYADKVPGLSMLGTAKDNVALIIALTLASKLAGGRVPIVRKIARNGIKIEAAMVGQELAQGGLNLTGGSNSGGSNVW